MRFESGASAWLARGLQSWVVPLLLTLFVPVFNPVALCRAQAANVIHAQVDPARVQPLLDHHPVWANSANDSGLQDPNASMQALTLVLSPSAEQRSALEQLLIDQQNPLSAEYHHWLTPAEVGERFGLKDADIVAITGWLQAQGLRVNWVAPSKMFIGFGGSSADVSRAFHTELHNYVVKGKALISVSSDPMIPEALAPAIKAIYGLYTIDDAPQSVYTMKESSSPEITASNGSHFIGPWDFHTIYNLPNGLTGSGVTIGIVGRSRTNTADFDNFRNLVGTPFPNPVEVVPTAFGGVDPGPALTAPPASGVSIGDQGEATLDVLRAGSVAYQAQLLLVVATADSGGIATDAQYLVNTTPVPAQILSISFGACESAAGAARVNYWDTLFMQAAAEGISSFVSSGDSGASGCDLAFQAPPASPQPNSPNYICSSSYAVCVGGTQFNDTANPSQYWTVASGSVAPSAIGYIPEGGWNESWDGTHSIVASSGGGVSAYIPTPSWQQGVPGVPSANAGRYTPDVSFSSSMHDGYFSCFAAGGGSCVISGGSFRFEIFGGTSAATPSVAGIAALLNQNDGHAEGNLNPGIYQMYAGAPTAFHDATLASSGVNTCDLSTPSLCNNSIPGPSGLGGGQAGFTIATGYDEVTGLGSLDASTFVNAFATASKIMDTKIWINAPTTIPSNQPFGMSVTVAGGPQSPAPTGTVNLTIGSYTGSATLSGGTATFDFTAGKIPVGNYSVNVTYTPDFGSTKIYNGASASQPMTIIVPPKVTPYIAITPSQQVISNSQPITVGVVVNGMQYYPTPTGTVSLSGGGYASGPQTLVAANASFTIPAGSLAVGDDTLTVSYTPDDASAPSYLATSNFTYVQNQGARITPSVWFGIDPTFPTTAQTINVQVTLNGFSGNPVPTGTVVVTSGSYTSAPATITNAYGSGYATVAIAPGVLPAGMDRITATYTPDARSSGLYASAQGSGSVGVALAQKITPAVAFTQIGANPTTIQPLALTISLSGGTGNPVPTGTLMVGAANYPTVYGVLSGGSATVSLPPGSFTGGANVITAQYTPDGDGSYFYDRESATTTVTVAKVPPVITLTPDLSNASTTDGINVLLTVGGGPGAPPATGTIQLTSGAYSSDPWFLTMGKANAYIAPGSLVPGNDTLTATFAGDGNYTSAAGTAAVTVTAPAGAGFAISSPAVTMFRGYTYNAKVTVTPSNGFVGTVSLTAAVTAQPQGAQNPPVVNFGSKSTLNLMNFNPANATLAITTTAATSGMLTQPGVPVQPWLVAGAATLSYCVMVLVRIRRRRWMRLVSMVCLFALFAAVAVSCGGGGGVPGGGGGGGGNPGTTAGQYTITVTGTSGATTTTSTITLNVQ